MSATITIRQLDSQISSLSQYYDAMIALCCALQADPELLEAVKKATDGKITEFQVNGISNVLLRQQTFLKTLRDTTQINPVASVDTLAKLL